MGKSAEEGGQAVKQIGIFLSHIDELKQVSPSAPGASALRQLPRSRAGAGDEGHRGRLGQPGAVAVPPEGRIELIMQALPGEASSVQRDDRLAGQCGRPP